jgi:hypothetical protein
MTRIVPLASQLPKNPDIYPAPTIEQATERLARELVATLATLRRAELMGEAPKAEAIERAERTLAAATSTARLRLEQASSPATHEDIAANIAAMIGSNPHGGQVVGEVYGPLIVADVGALEPSKGAIEAACRKLRTNSEWLPKIPELLAAVREAEQVYTAARRALNELPGIIARANQRLQRHA